MTKASDILTQDIRQYAETFPFKEKLKGKTVMVTGATGLIGSLIVKVLVCIKEEFGIDVRIIGVARNAEKVRSLFGSVAVEWFTDVNLESGELPSIDVTDYIIHCASPTASAYFINHPVETYLTTIEGTNALLAFASRVCAESMVYLSSLEYYGVVDEEREIFEEDLGVIEPYDVRSSYSMGKRVAESLCHAYFKEYGTPVKVARLTQVFGAGISAEDNRVFAQFARSALNGEDIILHTEGRSAKPYSYTMDAIDAIFHILFRGKDGEAYNVANPETYVSIREFAEMVQKEFNVTGKVVVKLESGRGYAPDTKLRLNVDKLKGLGWIPRYSLNEMAGRLIQYLKEIKK